MASSQPELAPVVAQSLLELPASQREVLLLYAWADLTYEEIAVALNVATGTVRGKWVIPHGGSPDMGGLNAAGTVLWLSGRYNSEVYAFDTSDGHLLARVKVGRGPHGMCVWPQPGRYSLGHTGVMR